MSYLNVSDVENRLRGAVIPMRNGEIADWPREATALAKAAVPGDPNRSLETLVAYRINGVPLAYLVEFEPFLGCSYRVEPGVVIPHPASELLAAAASAALRDAAARRATPQLLEVGVGVGNISISCLSAVPSAIAHASELQGAALRLTRANSSSLLSDPQRLRLYQAYDTETATEPFEHRPVKAVDVVAANPPYLIEGDPISDATKRSGIAHLSYAPVEDPSWFLKSLLAAAPELLSPDCSVVMECAHSYQSHHGEVMQSAGWRVEFYSREEYDDIHGLPPLATPMTPSPHRVMIATRGQAKLVS
jgi:HemK-like putative methylase